MATPHVAGAWAILKQRSPAATVADVLDALQTTGLPLTDPRNGVTVSRIQILQALASLAVPPDLVASPTVIQPGGILTATWRGIVSPTSTDWIGLYQPGVDDGAYIDWIYVSCSQTPDSPRASGSCPFAIAGNLAPGNYELRLFANNGFTRLATSNTFTVTSGNGEPILTVSPASIPAGGTVTATWTGIAVPTSTDWIGLFASSAADTVFIDWLYVSCSKSPGSPEASGSCSFIVPASLSPGDYELRLFANDGFTRLTTSNAFTVMADGILLTASPTTIPAGGMLTTTWTGIPFPTAADWIGLFAPGAPETAFIDWIYVSCSKMPRSPEASGSCSFMVPTSLEPGNHELRLLANDGFTRLATSNTFTVTPGQAVAAGQPGAR
jgi:hypothetical protein